ncbi:MAG TPA: sigma-70 family RNA polymerase sigma factor [Tepidisphaeraceae bacterium]
MSADEPNRKFHDVVWPHLATVLRVARILTGEDAEAEDLAQDTMLRAFRGIESFAPGTDAKAWLLTILRRTRIDRLRSPGTATDRAVSLEALEIEPAGETAESKSEWERPGEILNAFSDRQVIEALQMLPEEIRLTLLLVDVEGMDQRDAASVLEVPVGTIKSRAHRGRAMLRRALLPMAKEMRFVRE